MTCSQQYGQSGAQLFVFKLPPSSETVLRLASVHEAAETKHGRAATKRAMLRKHCEADPLAKRIRTSACTAHRYHLPQLLTARLHVVQTVHPAERQPQSFRCDLSRNPLACSCDNRSTLDREGLARCRVLGCGFGVFRAAGFRLGFGF